MHTFLDIWRGNLVLRLGFFPWHYSLTDIQESERYTWMRLFYHYSLHVLCKLKTNTYVISRGNSDKLFFFRSVKGKNWLHLGKNCSFKVDCVHPYRKGHWEQDNSQKSCLSSIKGDQLSIVSSDFQLRQYPYNVLFEQCRKESLALVRNNRT